MIDNNSNLGLGGSATPYKPIFMERRSPHTAWQYNAPQPVKHEAMEDDSGINSGSDFHSSSPGSDTSHDHYHAQPQRKDRFYSMPQTSHDMNLYAHDPLTPPNSEPLVSPKSEVKDMETTLSPCASPGKTEETQDHLRRLQISLEKTGLFVPKTAEPTIDESNSDNEVEEYEEQTWKHPKVNSHGKPKFLKCKQCDFVTDTKEKYWNHITLHIPEDKRLTCRKCPFITEYKHHLEYHLRWHAGSKPFQCSKCDYSCVNKSMLNSHMKSHSNVYRYSCSNCSYATKYCHSLKIHLRRYDHRPNVVLDEDGKPCPDVIIDVYGTRRGPKLKSHQNTKSEELSPLPEPLPFNLNLLGAAASQQLPFPPYPFFGGFQNAQLLQKLIERQAFATIPQPSPPVEEETNPIDLSKPGCSFTSEHKNRRKGPAFRIDPSVTQQSEDEEDEDTSTTTMFSNVEAVVQPAEDAKKADASDNNNSNNKKETNTCQYCDIAFGDVVMYTIHMGYHGFCNPFTCNMCGVECADKTAFFLHMTRASHSF